MKHFFTTILLFISILTVSANPLPSTSAAISELQFRADGSWILEIAINDYYEGMPIEEIWIKSNSGESMIRNFVIDSSHLLLVVENDSLTTPLFINPLQDTVSCAVKWNGYTQPSYTQLTYGYPNLSIRAPKIGQSIASYFPDGSWYSITKFPSIGFANDSTGMMGTVKGMIYDKNGLPLVNMSNKGLAFDYSSLYMGFTFFPQSDGSYSLRYFSRDVNVNSLFYDKGNYPVYYHTVDITPINFSMQPDSIVIQDIYLVGDIITGIDEINSNTEPVLKIYPQPVKQQLLNYEISIPVKSAETYLIFRNMNGQEIYRFSVTENKGVITLPENIKNGAYIVQLIANKKNYATNKLIVQ